MRYNGKVEADGPWVGLPLVTVEMRLAGTTLDGRRLELDFPNLQVPDSESVRYRIHYSASNPDITSIEDRGIYSLHHVKMNDADQLLSLQLNKLKLVPPINGEAIYTVREVQ